MDKPDYLPFTSPDQVTRERAVEALRYAVWFARTDSGYDSDILKFVLCGAPEFSLPGYGGGIMSAVSSGFAAEMGQASGATIPVDKIFDHLNAA